MTSASRIDDLRRRVDHDPASIVFAQLAEEHRRNGNYGEAVRVARAGLVRFPAYLSARVTLGRALLQLGQAEEARRELESVLASAPDNLAALRGMAEIRDHDLVTASAAAQAAAPSAADEAIALTDRLEQFASEEGGGVRVARAPAAAAVGAGGDPSGSAKVATRRGASNLRQFVRPARGPHPADKPAHRQADRPAEDAAAVLEGWLAAIVADRAARR